MRTSAAVHAVLPELGRYGVSWAVQTRQVFSCTRSKCHFWTCRWFGLPPGLPVEPGVQVRDWLVVIAAADAFAAAPFELPPLGAPSAVATTCAPLALRAVIERLGHYAGTRDLSPAAPATAGGWWTLVLPVTTAVPAAHYGG